MTPMDAEKLYQLLQWPVAVMLIMPMFQIGAAIYSAIRLDRIERKLDAITRTEEE